MDFSQWKEGKDAGNRGEGRKERTSRIQISGRSGDSFQNHSGPAWLADELVDRLQSCFPTLESGGKFTFPSILLLLLRFDL